MKFLTYISGILAVISIVLAFIARFLAADKALLGLSALSYLRLTNTMLLFTIAFLVYDWVKRKKE